MRLKFIQTTKYSLRENYNSYLSLASQTVRDNELSPVESWKPMVILPQRIVACKDQPTPTPFSPHQNILHLDVISTIKLSNIMPNVQ
jgi:hypothetical protein